MDKVMDMGSAIDDYHPSNQLELEMRLMIRDQNL